MAVQVTTFRGRGPIVAVALEAAQLLGGATSVRGRLSGRGQFAEDDCQGHECPDTVTGDVRKDGHPCYRKSITFK